MNVQFEVGQAIKFHRNGKKCRGVVMGMRLSFADTGVEDYLIVLRRKQTIEVKISDVIFDEMVEAFEQSNEYKASCQVMNPEI